jgi:hypothetical protein
MHLNDALPMIKILPAVVVVTVRILQLILRNGTTQSVQSPPTGPPRCEQGAPGKLMGSGPHLAKVLSCAQLLSSVLAVIEFVVDHLVV